LYSQEACCFSKILL